MQATLEAHKQPLRPKTLCLCLTSKLNSNLGQMARLGRRQFYVLLAPFSFFFKKYFACLFSHWQIDCTGVCESVVCAVMGNKPFIYSIKYCL